MPGRASVTRPGRVRQAAGRAGCVDASPWWGSPAYRGTARFAPDQSRARAGPGLGARRSARGPRRTPVSAPQALARRSNPARRLAHRRVRSMHIRSPPTGPGQDRSPQPPQFAAISTSMFARCSWPPTTNSRAERCGDEGPDLRTLRTLSAASAAGSGARRGSLVELGGSGICRRLDSAGMRPGCGVAWPSSRCLARTDPAPSASTRCVRCTCATRTASDGAAGSSVRASH